MQQHESLHNKHNAPYSRQTLPEKKQLNEEN